MSQYYGIYCKDGLNMMIGRHSKKQVNELILIFQAKANELCASNILRFMVDIWDEWGVDEFINIECVTYTTTNYFPYLDTELYWEGTDLQFCVNMKKNQELKYLKQGTQTQKFASRPFHTASWGD